MYLHLIFLPYIITISAISYDLYITRTIVGMYNSHVLLEVYGIFCYISNMILFEMYKNYFDNVIKILIVSQLGDILQYIIGRRYGVSYVGWLSPKKTYEGYIGGFIATILILMPFYNVYSVFVVYIFAVIGGLISSYIKRYYNIKDYSTVLGNHGGWLDRSDSIYLPTIVEFIICKYA